MFLYNIISRIFLDRNTRILKSYSKIVKLINGFENKLATLNLSQLTLKTEEFKRRLLEGSLPEDILPESYAVVREVSKRVLNMRHFDVQLIGGICLFYGKIAEMQTGEGKTLVATLPAYLNFLLGVTIHIVTVNDYLAKRDGNWMQPVFDVLGVRVGILTSEIKQIERKGVYLSDVVYGTNNEFVFDYLRDTLVLNREFLVQRDLFFTVIDEVDSILIDEARTPLIISGISEDSSSVYKKINNVVSSFLKRELRQDSYFIIDEKAKQVTLTDRGYTEFEGILRDMGFLKNEGDSTYTKTTFKLFYHIQIALKANIILKCNVDYVKKHNTICIVDEHTGRILEGRRWSDGLHQAVEAKENVFIQQENKTLTSITFQNYFRLYKKLSGMTGTAVTECVEFKNVYGLEVVVVPTNKKCIRVDYADIIYLTKSAKYVGILKDVLLCIKKNQPVLIGTATIEVSEVLSSMFINNGIKHNVLNAKLYEREAAIIAEAGKPGVITIATNMAGRGTDIILGGAPTNTVVWYEESKAVNCSGGLYIIGTERYESRRIDNQLRGRSGRQGDPGSSLFYLSIEDDLLRVFISSQYLSFLRRLWSDDTEFIQHKLISNAIKNAQTKVEVYYADVRKQLLEFDDIINEQRVIVSKKRFIIVYLDDVYSLTSSFIYFVLKKLYSKYFEGFIVLDLVLFKRLCVILKKQYNIEVSNNLKNIFKSREYLEDYIQLLYADIIENYKNKRKSFGYYDFCKIEKSILLYIFDLKWREYLEKIEQLKQSVDLQRYIQKDPKQEYRRRVYFLFSIMLDDIRQEFCRFVFKIKKKT